MIATLFGLLLAPKPAYAKTFTVNSTCDAADDTPGNGVCQVEGFVFGCSLRAAIEEANEYPGADTINFNLSATDPNCDSSGVCTISPDSELPDIDARLTLNGYSQPGAKPNTKKSGINNAVLKIELDGISAGADAVGLFVKAKNSVVKGLVINRFDGNGVFLGSTASGSKVQGNFIGTNPEGTSSTNLGNGASGVLVSGSANNTIGGRYPSQRNVISGNGGIGVWIFDPGPLGTTGNKVQGNRIGTNKNGSFDLGNDFDGVRISASDNIVGGSRSGQANVIAFNDGDGVSVEGDASTGNRILRNSMHDNGGLGIDLGGDGETPNDGPGDADPGPNNLQNFPDITFLFHSGDSTIIEGVLESAPNTTFTIQVFQIPFDGENEGFRFLGKKSVTTDSNGEASFKLTTNKVVEPLTGVTATATDPDGNTSEFEP
ncbi:MAG: right-handed parallel beta-helix repeat-containing protein [Actinomycetota bacterium]|nr:right-handed parallel beta-helix repeat-containing protein [Actinomycetota bacterium]